MAKKYDSITIPEGTFEWPYLLVPDSYKNKDEFKVDTRVPLSTAQPIIDAIEKIRKTEKARDHMANGDTPVSYHEMDYVPYTVDEAAGFATFRAKLKKFGGSRGNTFEQCPDVYDAQMNLLDSTTKVMAGSTGLINVVPYRWGDADEGKIGVSLRLMGAQVLEVVSKTVRSPESHGFAAKDGGFDVNTAPAEEQDADGDINSDGREKY